MNRVAPVVLNPDPSYNKYFESTNYRYVHDLFKYNRFSPMMFYSHPKYLRAIKQQQYWNMTSMAQFWWLKWFFVKIREEKDLELYKTLIANKPSNKELDLFFFKDEPVAFDIDWVGLFDKAYYKTALNSILKHIDKYNDSETVYYYAPAFWNNSLNDPVPDGSLQERIIDSFSKKQLERIKTLEPVLYKKEDVIKHNIYSVYVMLANMYKTIKTVLDVYKQTQPLIYDYIMQNSPLLENNVFDIEDVIRFLNDFNCPLNKDLIMFLHDVYIQYYTFCYFLGDLLNIYPLDDMAARSYIANSTIEFSVWIKSYFERVSYAYEKPNSVPYIFNSEDTFMYLNKDTFDLARIKEYEANKKLEK